MASHHLLHSLSLALIFVTSMFIVDNISAQLPTEPLACSTQTPTCDAVLYHNTTGLTTDQIASFYSVNSSAIANISSGSKKQDFLISVACSCANPIVNGNITGYIYDTVYKVQPNDTFFNVSSRIYSGQALRRGGEENSFIAGNSVVMHLLCGCGQNQNKTVVTYTVQQGDFLSSIAARLSSSVDEIMSLNKIQNPAGLIFVGQVLFVPGDKDKLIRH